MTPKETPPSVDIVIPAYECASTLPDVLKAVCNQTVKPSKIIVVDDCSPDRLESIVKAFPCVYVRNEKNLGLSKSLNTGLRQSDAPFVMTLHSDCILDEDYIERLLQFMLQTPQAGVATGIARYENPTKLRFSDQMFFLYNFLDEQPQTPTDTHELSYVEGKSDLWRREVIKECGYFNEDLRIAGEDHDLSYKLKSKGFFLYIVKRAKYLIIFNDTQNTILKVLKKQKNYAEAIGYLITTFGFNVGGKASRLFPRRAFFRSLQILGGMIFIFCLLGYLFTSKIFLLPLIPVYLLRLVYLIYCARQFGMGRGFLLSYAHPALDIIYLYGLICGVLKAKFLKRT
jgi:glycosyltransferase involved in cell wall biosynthesis